MVTAWSLSISRATRSSPRDWPTRRRPPAGRSRFGASRRASAWNPLASGGPSELKDKLIGLEQWTEPHYKRAAERYLQAVFRVLDANGTSATLAGSWR